MQGRRRGAVAALAAMAMALIPALPAAAAEVGVSIENFLYNPDPVQVDPGDTITWTNNDPGPHTVSADDGSFSALLNEGETFTYTVEEEGAFGYFCKLHGAPGEGMFGTIVSGPPAAPARFTATGADNTAVAVSWSQSAFPDGSGFALLGRADLFADSLASAVGQGTLGGPLLLTGAGSLDERTLDELERLGVDTVYLLGGQAALSADVEEALNDAGIATRRLAGGTRTETAIEVAEAFLPEARGAILVRSSAAGDPIQGFVDALGAGALAVETGQPVLFTDTDRLSAATKAYLESTPIDTVTIIGGEAAVSAQVVTDLEALGIQVDRIAGGDRFGTAVEIAGRLGGAEGPRGYVLVDGLDPDSWVDGFAAAVHGLPVLVTSGDDLPPSTLQVLLFGHEGQDVLCGASAAGAACENAATVLTANTDFPTVGTFVTGGEEVPPTEHFARGLVGLYPTVDPSTICYDYFGVPIEDLSAAHIHEAPAGENGDIVLPLDYVPGADGLIGCSFDVDAALVADILVNPADYYANLHTEEFPNGAVRGQLFVPRLIGIGEGIGEGEIPPVDSEGFAFSFLIGTDTPGEVCAPVFAFGVSSTVTAAHIHRGAADEEGPPVITLDTPVDAGGQWVSINCYDAGEALLDEIEADPGAFYLNVHTETNPDGEVRGQLFNPFD